jgi:hypothetical protein
MPVTEAQPTLPPEHLRHLSLDQLTELCFETQFPEYRHERLPVGYLALGDEPILANFHETETARRELSNARHNYELDKRIGRIGLKKKLAEAEEAARLPENIHTVPVFDVRREFKSNIQKVNGEWKWVSGDEYFHFINRALAYQAPDGELVKLIGSEEIVYSWSKHSRFIGQNGKELNRTEQKAFYKADFEPDNSPYDLSYQPEYNVELLPQDELRNLLIKWGDLF